MASKVFIEDFGPQHAEIFRASQSILPLIHGLSKKGEKSSQNIIVNNIKCFGISIQEVVRAF